MTLFGSQIADADAQTLVDLLFASVSFASFCFNCTQILSSAAVRCCVSDA